MSSLKVPSIEDVGEALTKRDTAPNPIQQTQPAIPATVDSAGSSPLAAQMESAAGAVIEEDELGFQPVQSPMQPHQQDEFADKNLIAQGYDITATQAHDPVSSLPDDVAANLNRASYERMQQEEVIMRVLAKPGALYSVDKIVIMLWNDHQLKIDRMKIHQRLRALVHQKLVHREPRGRGIFSLTESGRNIIKG